MVGRLIRYRPLAVPADPERGQPPPAARAVAWPHGGGIQLPPFVAFRGEAHPSVRRISARALRPSCHPWHQPRQWRGRWRAAGEAAPGASPARVPAGSSSPRFMLRRPHGRGPRLRWHGNIRAQRGRALGRRRYLRLVAGGGEWPGVTCLGVGGAGGGRGPPKRALATAAAVAPPPSDVERLSRWRRQLRRGAPAIAPPSPPTCEEGRAASSDWQHSSRMGARMPRTAMRRAQHVYFLVAAAAGLRWPPGRPRGRWRRGGGPNLLGHLQWGLLQARPRQGLHLRRRLGRGVRLHLPPLLRRPQRGGLGEDVEPDDVRFVLGPSGGQLWPQRVPRSSSS